MGPSFIKLGQLLSTRADLLGDELAADLASLQDRLPPFPGAQARAAIEREFGTPLETLFVSFDETAVAAASIAQVHFARTPDGQDVAVKVLRPGVAQAFARDLDLFLWLAGWVERLYPPSRRLKPVEIVQTLAEVVRFEMDLRFEAAAGSELAENFAGDPSFRVPRIDWQRTGHNVLTLERISGIRIDDRAALLAAGHQIDRAAGGRRPAPFSTRCSVTAFFMPTCTRGTCSSMRPGRSSSSISGSWDGSIAPPAITSPTC